VPWPLGLGTQVGVGQLGVLGFQFGDAGERVVDLLVAAALGLERLGVGVFGVRLGHVGREEGSSVVRPRDRSEARSVANWRSSP
jgi:hypothetical protein